MAVGTVTTRFRSTAVDWFAASIGWLASTPGGLRILTFHDINDDVGDAYGVTKGRLADYLSLLHDEGYTTIRDTDLVDNWPSVLFRDRVVLLTFDDGYAAHRDTAAELLSQYGMTATFFVVSSLLKQNRLRFTFSGQERTFLGTEDLRQLVLGGFGVGSHSHTHVSLGTMPADWVGEEARLSKGILEEAIGCEIGGFAYPFGRRGAHSLETRSVLAKSGYLSAFTQEGTTIRPTTEPLEFPRVNVGRSDTILTFRRKLEGQYALLPEIMKYVRHT